VGRQALEVTSVTAADPSLITFSPAPPFTIQPGGSQTVTLTINSVPTQDLETSLTITSNDPNQGERVVPIQISVLKSARMVVSPLIINLGGVAVGSSVDSVFNISNTGNDQLTGSVGVVSQNAQAFFSVFPESFDIDPGQERSIRVRIDPEIEGFLGAEIEVASNVDTVTVEVTARASGTTGGGDNGNGQPVTGISVTPLFIFYGSVAVDSTVSRTVIVRNGSSSTISGSANISGSGFRLLTSPLALPLQIAAGDSAEVTVRFTPDRVTDYVATLGITLNNQNQPAIPLNGAGRASTSASATINVQPQPLDFGVLRTGETDTRALTVLNQGSGTLTVFNIVSGESAFSLQNRAESSFDLGPGENKRIQIVVSPTRRGKITGTLTIQSNDAQNPNFPVTVQVDVEGAPGPTFRVITEPVDFGQVGFGERQEINLVIKNEGVAPGQIFGIRPDNNQVKVISQIPVTVQPDNTIAIVLVYSPLPYRSRDGEITLFSEDEGNPRFKVGWQASEVPVTAVEVLTTSPRDRDGDVGPDPFISVRFSEAILTYGRNFVAADVVIQPRPITRNWQKKWDITPDGRTLKFEGVQLEDDRVYRMTVISEIARSGNELIQPVDLVFSTGSTNVEDVGSISGVVSLAKPFVQLDGTAIIDTTQEVIGRVIAVDQNDQIVAETTITECGAYELDGLPPDDYKIYVEIEGEDRPINIGIDRNHDNIPDQVTIRPQEAFETFDMVVEDIELTDDAPGAIMFDGDPTAGYQPSSEVAADENDVVTVALYAQDVENLTRVDAVIEYDNTQLQFADFQMPTGGDEVAFLSTGDLDQAISASKAPVVDRQGDDVTVQPNQIRIQGKSLNGSQQNAVSGGCLFGLISFIKTGSTKLAKAAGKQVAAPEIKLKRITLFGVDKRKTIENAGTIVVTEGVSTGVPPNPGAPNPDFSGNGKVGFEDFVQLARAFSSKPGNPLYDAKIDLDSNGEIGFSDFVIFARAYGK